MGIVDATPRDRTSDAARPVVAVVDIDGVVADVRHRLWHLDSRPRDWNGFFAGAAADPLLPEGQAVVTELAREATVVWVTGRPARLRRVTVRWLRRHGLPAEHLVMRGDADRRPARVYKREAVRELRRSCRVTLVVDDDPEVIEVLRADGFPVRLAAWVPRGATLHDAQEQAGRS
jgi:hypothetical protein